MLRLNFNSSLIKFIFVMRIYEMWETEEKRREILGSLMSGEGQQYRQEFDAEFSKL